MTVSDARRTIDGVWKHECGRLVATLARIVRDIGLAEEIAHDALVIALEQWPSSGIPEKPAAWLMATAKHRALNAVRRARLSDTKYQELGHQIETQVRLEDLEAKFEAAMDNEVSDDVLRLVFSACHPLLAREARVALTLRLIGGLSVEEIARAFLTSESSIAQRIVRAKRSLADAGVPFEVPAGVELSARLASVLEVVYLIFNEGYSATAGPDLLRPNLIDEALRLGELLTQLAGSEPEVHGLVALMLIQASRVGARTDAHGEPVLLDAQDRARWNADFIARGLNALTTAEALTSQAGAYQLQAAIAACHARAPSAATTDWTRIAQLYGNLARLAPSPVIELNRALAIARAEGPARGLVLLDALTPEPALAHYHLLPSARADLLEKLGRLDEARAAFEQAASLAANARQRARLTARAQACTKPK